MIHQLPKILRVSQFEHVTYSQLVDLQKCFLRGAAGQLVLSVPLPDPIPTRASIVGTFHHQAMEAATLGLEQDQLEKRLEGMIAATQVTVSACPHLRRLGPVSNWDEINRSFTTAMRRFRAQRGGTAFEVVQSERLLASSDGALIGKPDRYAIIGDRAVLKDFKTSALRDSQGKIREEYLAQLRFYAALLVDNYPVTEVAAQLESSTDGEFSLVIGADEARRFATDVKGILTDVNRRIADLHSALDLASPSSDACNYCSLRIVCSPFASRQNDLSLERAQFVLTATVRSVQPEASGPTISLELDRGDRTFRLVVPSELSNQLRVHRRYVFANLDVVSTGFRWTDLTQVFSVD